MSFLKKIKKVLAMLSPWGNSKPVKKSSRKRKKKSASDKTKERIRQTSVKKKKVTRKKKLSRAAKSAERKPISSRSHKSVKPIRRVELKKPIITKAKAVKKGPSPLVKSARLKRILVGEVTHYFDRVQVAAFMVTGSPIVLGDALEFEGKNGVFRQEIKSLQINRVAVKSARAGDEVGILVKKPVREGDYVFKVL